MGDRDSLSERKAFRRQGSGRGNDFADLSVNRSKLLIERSHALINVRLGCNSVGKTPLQMLFANARQNWSVAA
jgi:hypothetical protein